MKFYTGQPSDYATDADKEKLTAFQAKIEGAGQGAAAQVKKLQAELDEMKKDNSEVGSAH